MTVDVCNDAADWLFVKMTLIGYKSPFVYAALSSLVRPLGE